MPPDVTGPFLYTSAGKEHGPVSYGDLRLRAFQGELDPARDFVLNESEGLWVRAGTFKGLVFPTQIGAATVYLDGGPMMQTAEGRALMRDATRPKPVNFAPFCALAVAGVLLLPPAAFLAFVGSATMRPFLAKLSLVMIAVSGALITAATVLWFIILYRMWAGIQDGMARTTPGTAVRRCFVPFIQFYWLFVAWHGWSRDYNLYVEERGLRDAPRATEPLFYAFCLLTALSFVPCVGLLSGALALCLWVITTWQACRAVNYLASRR